LKKKEKKVLHYSGICDYFSEISNQAKYFYFLHF